MDTPKIRLALISAGFEHDPVTNLYSMYDIFETNRVQGFPVEGNFVVTVFWDLSGEAEITDQRFTLVYGEPDGDPGDTLAARFPAREFTIGEEHISIAEFSEILFQESGRYIVNIHANGILVGCVSFFVQDI